MLKQHIYIIPIIVALSGCASNNGTAGVYPSTEKLNQLYINKSSKKEVKNILGKAKKIIIASNDTEYWIYKSTDAQYTETYAAKKALSFAPVPFLGTALGAIDTGPNQTGVTHTLSLVFSKKGVLKSMQREIEHF